MTLSSWIATANRKISLCGSVSSSLQNSSGQTDKLLLALKKNAAIGAVAFVSALMPLMTAQHQIRLALDIAAYNINMSVESIAELLGVVGGLLDTAWLHARSQYSSRVWLGA